MLRKEVKITQKKAAEIADVAQSTISAIESGVRYPDADVLYRLTRAYGITTEDVFQPKALTEEDWARLGFLRAHAALDQAMVHLRGADSLSRTGPSLTLGVVGQHAQERVDLATWSGQFRYLALPLLSDPAGAAEPRNINDSDIEDYAVVYAKWCPNPEKTTCIHIKGESMEPVLPDGSIVGIDSAVRTLAACEGRIVAVRDPDGGVTVKRCHVRADEKPPICVFQPANPRHAGLQISAAQVEDDELIVGLVIWAWSFFG